MNGGELIARVLEHYGVRFLFTLCGGHISPILVEAKRRGIRIVDVRHEATAVFAADAVARLTGKPGVVAVTAGPGCTNTLTAVKNAQLAQSPVLILGGATATLLKGRGSLQDIDQLALFGPHVKHAVTVDRVKELPGAVAEALEVARDGVPGPVFVECPVDLLYDASLVAQWYGERGGKSISGRLLNLYLRWHARRLFSGAGAAAVPEPEPLAPPTPSTGEVRKVAKLLSEAKKPVLVLGAQTTLVAEAVDELAEAVTSLGVPTYLASNARGLLGVDHPLQLRHKRRKALKASDLVILAGFPADFRLDYGYSISRKAKLVGINRSAEDLELNRRPDVGVVADPGLFLRRLREELEPGSDRWTDWLSELRERDGHRDAEIAAQADEPAGDGLVNPLALCREIDRSMADDSVLVVDGGDFVATASYIVRPRGPLRWLDPGAFGTLGVGGGFALGAKLVRPEAEVWLLWGDGSAAYSLAELDTFARHGIPVIAVVGNDAGWTQIAREQVDLLGDDVGTVLARTAYHTVAEGYGAKGLVLDDPAHTSRVLAEARETARAGRPVLVNAHLGSTDFRKGSISM
jgi:acetolactate synthase-like protein